MITERTDQPTLFPEDENQLVEDESTELTPTTAGGSGGVKQFSPLTA
jgi:hypothetical protein